MVGVHLLLVRFWPLNLKSIVNTGIQWNICLYIIAQHSKGRPEKTKLQKYSHIGPTRATD